MSEIILTKDGIKKCFQTEVLNNKVKHSLDLNLQIISAKIQTNKKDNKDVLACTLSDSNFKHNYFVFAKNFENLKENVIVNIKEINHHLMANNTTHAFIIKKFSVINDQETKIIGNPVNYSDDIVEETVNNQENVEIKEVKYLPLYSLTPYSNNFSVCVKVTKKPNEIRTYTNKKGNGKIFTFNIIDKDMDEMQVTVFNKNAERVWDLLQVDKTYEIKNPDVRPVDKNYCNFRTDYRLIIEDITEVIEKPDLIFNTKKDLEFNFKTINELRNLKINEIVDVIGIIFEVSEKSSICAKGEYIEIQRLKIGDDSMTKMDLCIWRKLVSDYDFKVNDIVAFKSLRIGKFLVKNLNTNEETKILIDPDLPEKKRLSEFLENQKIIQNYEYQDLSSRFESNAELTTLDRIVSLLDSVNEEKKFENFRLKAYVTNFTNDLRNIYAGCPSCKRKLNEEKYGYACSLDTCMKNIENPVHYYSFVVKIMDNTHGYFVDFYGNIGEKLINLSADEYQEHLLSSNYKILDQIEERVNFKKFNLVVQPVVTIYNKILRKRIKILYLEEIDKDEDIKISLDYILKNSN